MPAVALRRTDSEPLGDEMGGIEIQKYNTETAKRKLIRSITMTTSNPQIPNKAVAKIGDKMDCNELAK